MGEIYRDATAGSRRDRRADAPAGVGMTSVSGTDTGGDMPKPAQGTTRKVRRSCTKPALPRSLLVSNIFFKSKLPPRLRLSEQELYGGHAAFINGASARWKKIFAMPRQPVDGDPQRALLLFCAAMRLHAGRIDDVVVEQSAGAFLYYDFCFRSDIPAERRRQFVTDSEAGRLRPDHEFHIYEAIALAIANHVVKASLGRLGRRNKRRTRRHGVLRMRLNDPHYMAVWWAEKQMQSWCIRHGKKRCLKQDAIVDDVITKARNLGVVLEKKRLLTILREPKKRRFTNILYFE
jgi:hypothetical protein